MDTTKKPFINYISEWDLSWLQPLCGTEREKRNGFLNVFDSTFAFLSLVHFLCRFFINDYSSLPALRYAWPFNVIWWGIFFKMLFFTKVRKIFSKKYKKLNIKTRTCVFWKSFKCTDYYIGFASCENLRHKHIIWLR